MSFCSSNALYALPLAISALIPACTDAPTTASATSTDATPDAARTTTTDTAAADNTAPDATAADAATNTAPDAATTGLPYSVGLLKLDTPGPGKRTLPTLVWYPIPSGTKGEVEKYALGLIESPLGAIENAAAAQGPFPTVVFSHGNQGVPEQSVFLTEGLAARGYVVVAPEHVGNSFATYDQALAPAISLWRPQDLKAAVDRIAKPQANDPTWLTGLADTEKLAVVGHSFGGYTALAYAGFVINPPPTAVPKCDDKTKDEPACQEIAKIGPPPWNLGDPRVDLTVPLAHALTAGFDAKSFAAGKVPVVLAAAKGDTITPYKSEAEAAYSKLAAPKALLTIDGGGHFSFANLCELAAVAPANLQPEIKKLCAKDAVPTLADSHLAVLHVTAAACDVYLKGKDAARAEFKPGPVAGLAAITLASDGIVK
jgi:predicted dienelactone hydrolase